MKMDQIQMLLMKTGMSPDELIQKLAEYKGSGSQTTPVKVKDEPAEEVICIDDDDVPPLAPLSNGKAEEIKQEIKVESNGTEQESVNANGINNNNKTIECEEIIFVDDDDDCKPTPPCDTNVNSKDIFIDLSDDDSSADGKEGIEEIIEDNYTNSEPSPPLPFHEDNATNKLPSDDNFDSEIPSEDSNSVNTRLKITSLLEKRFNNTSEIDFNKNLSEKVVVKSPKKVEKRPFIGSIRKRAKKIEEDEEMFSEEEEASSDENHIVPCPVEEEKTRQQIFNQLSMLRQRKSDDGPLVDIVNPIPQKLFSTKKPPVKTENDEIFPHFGGIKIVEVRGGIEKENCSTSNNNEEDMLVEIKKENTVDPLDIKTEETDEPGFEVINEDLDSHIIKVTKTDNFERIKGWKHKKLLINKPAKDIQMEMSSDETQHNLVINIPIPNGELIEPVAGCSYSNPVAEVKKIDIKTEAETDAAINVFASNNLDGFLNQQKNLNISYDVPNLESSEKSTIDLLDSTVIMHDPPKDTRQSDGKRLFTLAEDENASCINPTTKSNPYKPRTLAEKRKLLEMHEDSPSTSPPAKKYKEDPNSNIARDRNTLPNEFIYSSVYYKGRQYKVPAHYRKVIYIDWNNRKNKKKKYKFEPLKRSKLLADSGKPSIYANVKQETVRYKPGPLCKKYKLQNDSPTWATVVKELPNVYVNVKPEFGKQIHPIARQFVNFEEYDISPERADFALTALKSDDSDDPKSYKFDAHYVNNAQKMILLKSVKQVVREKAKATIAVPLVPVVESPKDIRLALNQVVDDMVTYVEHKEIGDSILQDDDYHPEISDENYLAADKKRGRRAEVIKGKSKKTNLELKRLNVKVIEVNIEEESDTTICNKTFCKLGCVCKSLRSTPLPNDHCRQASCIFECTCGFEKTKKDTLKFIVPPGTDILSDRTVSRLQDEAKKDLAKVEAEFTQTVIHAYNQTIVVGDSTERKRRPLKFPKKYRDYFETNAVAAVERSDDEEFIIKTVEESAPNSPIKEEVAVPIIPPVKAQPELRVIMEKIDLSHAIPLCLTHSTYNCECLFVGGPPQPKIQVKPFVQMMEPHEFDRERSSPEPDVWTPTGTRKYKKQKKWTYVKHGKNKNVNKVEPTSAKTKVEPECARTKGAPVQVLAQRNKTLKYKRKLTKMINGDLVGSDLHSFLKNSISTDVSDYKNDSPDPFLAPMAVESLEDGKGGSRRKQKLQVRDETAEPAIQRRKKPAKKVSDQLNISTDTIEPYLIETKKFSEMTGCQNPKEVKFRLLPWHMLLTKYLDKAIHIWYHISDNNKFKFMITNSNMRPFPDFKNINQFESFPNKDEIPGDFIRWVMNREMPDDKKVPGGGMYIILKITITCWEICGVCMRKPPPGEDGEENKSAATKKDVTLQDTKYQVSFNYALYAKRTLCSFYSNKGKRCKNLASPLKPELPAIDSSSKWRVIKLEPDITMIALTRNEFSIKCNDLRTIMNVAVAHKKTIIINNETVTVKYLHKQFGIYLSPNYKDYIFVGPYFHYENHDLRMMRTLNLTIVGNEAVKHGLTNTTDTGQWYQQANTSSEMRTEGVIDLTDNDEAEAPKVLDKKRKDRNAILRDKELWKKYDFLAKKYSNLSLKDKELARKGNELQKKEKELGEKDKEMKKVNGRKMVTVAQVANAVFEQQALTMEKLFSSRLRAVIKNLKLILPEACTPICYKVNFDKGLIYGYKHLRKQQVAVFWPGDNVASNRVFRNEQIAEEWLQKELNSFFILIPSTYRIEVNMIQPSEYREAISRPSIPSKYFKEVYVVGEFGTMDLAEAADELLKYNEIDEKGEEIVTDNPTFNGVLKQYHSGGDEEVAKLLHKLQVHIEREIDKEKKLLTMKKDLDVKKKSLLLNHTQLIKQVSNSTKEIIKKEFMQKWNARDPPPAPTPLQIVISSKTKTIPIVLAPSKSNSPPPLKPVSEVICLDSDEENSDPPKLKSFMDTNQDENDAVMLLDYDLPSAKKLNQRRSSTEIIPITKIQAKSNVPDTLPNPSAEIVSIKTIPPRTLSLISKTQKITIPSGQSLLKTPPTRTIKLNMNKPGSSVLKQSILKSKPCKIEKIDISHLRRDQVLSFIGGSTNLIVSQKDIDILKVLSETNPNKTDDGAASLKPL